MLKVLIVEDEKRIREGLVATMPWASMGYEVAGSASNGLDALDLLRRLEPEVMITDIRMPKMDGLSLLRQARMESPALRVLILSGYDEFEYARQALKYGASDFLVKPVREEELSEALRKIRESVEAERPIRLPPQLEETLSATPDADDELSVANLGLVRRIESFVALNYQRNLTLKDAADEAGLSPNYFSHLFKKVRGMNFTEYLSGVRIARACDLIAEGKLKIYEIAEAVGFTDYKYFSTVFRKFTGFSPTHYHQHEQRSSR